MTEATIRSVAKELAGQYYEMNCQASEKGHKVRIERGERLFTQTEPRLFLKTFPTFKDYLEGKRHGRIATSPEGHKYHVDDGSVQYDTPGWLHYYDLARQLLTQMLGDPRVHEHKKEAIYKALMEDREKQLKQETVDSRLSPNIVQRKQH